MQVRLDAALEGVANAVEGYFEAADGAAGFFGDVFEWGAEKVAVLDELAVGGF